MTRDEWLVAMNARLANVRAALAIAVSDLNNSVTNAKNALDSASSLLSSIPEVEPPPPLPPPDVTELDEHFTAPVPLGRDSSATFRGAGGGILIAPPNEGRINFG
jgi:hypothetical protein